MQIAFKTLSDVFSYKRDRLAKTARELSLSSAIGIVLTNSGALGPPLERPRVACLSFISCQLPVSSRYTISIASRWKYNQSVACHNRRLRLRSEARLRNAAILSSLRKRRLLLQLLLKLLHDWILKVFAVLVMINTWYDIVKSGQLSEVLERLINFYATIQISSQLLKLKVDKPFLKHRIIEFFNFFNLLLVKECNGGRRTKEKEEFCC